MRGYVIFCIFISIITINLSNTFYSPQENRACFLQNDILHTSTTNTITIMKRIIPILFAVISLLVITTSCNKDKFGTYNFLTNTFVNVVDQDRASQILEIIQKDSYFTTKHSYTEVWSKAAGQACDEFDEHIQALDVTSIEALVQYGEVVKISLWSMDPGQCLLTYAIYPTGVTSE